jgi:hypothetical protein
MNPIREMYVVLCSAGWIWCAMVFAYLFFRRGGRTP